MMRDARICWVLVAVGVGCRAPSPPSELGPGSASAAPSGAQRAFAGVDGGSVDGGAGACSVIPEDVKALAGALDDQPDMLHVDFTPAVHSLIDRGLVGACAVVDRLDAPGQLTRLHAQRVLEGVVAKRHGWRPGRGYPDGYGEERTRAVIAELGEPGDGGIEAWRGVAARWRAWLSAQPEVPLAYKPVDGPSREEMVAALDPARGALEKCVGALGPVDVTVVFAPTGKVSSIWSSYEIGKEGRRCLEGAVAKVAVAPFKREDARVVYTPASK